MRWDQRARRLDGPRIALQRFCPADAARLFAVVEANRSHLERQLRWPRNLTCVADVECWLRSLDAPDVDQPFSMGMIRKSDGALLGAAGLKRGRDEPESTVEISYWLSARAIGHGYCTEAVRMLVSHGLWDLGAVRVEVRVDPSNVASVRVCERAGLRLDGVLSASGGDPRSMAVYVAEADVA